LYSLSYCSDLLPGNRAIQNVRNPVDALAAVSNTSRALLTTPLDEVVEHSFLVTMHTPIGIAACGGISVVYPVVCS
jgi:hypothetical protein